MSIQNRTGHARRADQYELTGQCCPLPPGTLLDEHVMASLRCPDGSVITGSEMDPPGSDKYPRRVRSTRLRCTRVNPERASLAAETPGWRVGWGEDPLPRYLYSDDNLPRLTSRSRLPVELRYGVGRASPTAFSDNICIGVPFGSLVTAADDKSCIAIKFRQLIDRSTGKPYRYDPDCIALSDPLGPAPRCLSRTDD